MRTMQGDSHVRSGMKSLIWRLMGVCVLALITYLFTRSWIQTSLVTFIHHGVFLFVFYAHERFWVWMNWTSRWRHIVKMFTYETLLGNFILDLITYLITGDVRKMTYITLTYIGTKHIMYILYDYVWDICFRPSVYAYVVGDLLHVGHVRFLQEAAKHGCLTVGVLSNSACMEKKPQPIIPFVERLEMVKALKCVHRVVPQYTYSPTINVVMYKPDILIESESHADQPANDLVKKVVVLPYCHITSTTAIKQTVLRRFNNKQHSTKEGETQWDGQMQTGEAGSTAER